MSRGFTFLLLVIVLSICFAPRAAAETPAGNSPARAPDKTIVAFFAQHCVRCHGEKKQESNLRVDSLAADFVAHAATWDEIRFRLSGNEMPPPDEPQPTAEERASVVEWITAGLKEGEAARLARRERVSYRRLSRAEYAATIRDWLGIAYDPDDPAGLPDDDEWQGFERIGATQTISPAHIEKYFAAAESILAELFPDQTPQPFEFRREGWQMNAGPAQWAEWEALGIKDRVRYPIWPGHSLQHGRAGPGRLAAGGEYHFELKLSGLMPEKGIAPHLMVYAIELDRVLFERDVVTAENEPVTIRFSAHLPAGVHTLKILNQVPGPSLLPRSGRAGNKPFLSIAEGREPWQTKLTDEEGKPLWPFLILDSVLITGPHAAPATEQWRQELAAGNTPENLRRVLEMFATRAFRRPLTADELAGYAKLIEGELAAGASPISALKAGLVAIMCAKDFLYLIEGRPDVQTARLNDLELASRLSYFLWNSLPDEPLLSAAQAGRLHEQDELRTQVRRMLADPKAERLAASFPRQWLQLQKVGMFPPDKTLYPSYDDYLEQCFLAETTSYFREVLAQNLSIREFLDSDWTMLNSRLAGHYGIANVSGDEFRRVALSPADRRGGLLTHASVLSLTSDGQRHRPVHRGKWVLESIIGRPPPPPPANVDPIEPTPSDQPKATIRVKLNAHKSNEQCAACHRKIDPLGFAFDHYDAIGRYRTTEQVSDGAGENPLVDASGELPDGRKFAEAAEFKRLLAADLDVFQQALLEKLAMYTLRRTMTVDDRAGLAKIASTNRTAGYRLRDLIEALVVSDLFQSR